MTGNDMQVKIVQDDEISKDEDQDQKTAVIHLLTKLKL